MTRQELTSQRRFFDINHLLSNTAEELAGQFSTCQFSLIDYLVESIRLL